jgi:hypothetical protein
MILLATIWLILIQPNPGASAPELKGEYAREFSAEQVDFANQDDCETYAKMHLGDLLTRKKKSGKPVIFPPDALPTYTCVSIER